MKLVGFISTVAAALERIFCPSMTPPQIDIVLGVRQFKNARFELFNSLPTEAVTPAIEVDGFALRQSVGIAPK